MGSRAKQRLPRAIQEVSTITAKGQTTVPKAVRQALGVDYGGRIVFRIEGGRVAVERVAEEHEDPVIGAFLAFLAKDMGRQPQRIVELGPKLARRLAKLTRGVKVDPDAPIEGDVEL